MSATHYRKYACCSCCDEGVDPDLHAENGRDFHEADCTVCNPISATQIEAALQALGHARAGVTSAAMLRALRAARDAL